MTRRWHRIRVTRDLVLFSTALGLGTWEILFGGDKPEALTFCLAILVSPIAMGYDRGRRNRDREDDEQ